MINAFQIQILLPKSKEEWTEVICRLLSTFVTKPGETGGTGGTEAPDLC